MESAGQPLLQISAAKSVLGKDYNVSKDLDEVKCTGSTHMDS
jgi:hypothetical protein